MLHVTVLRHTWWMCSTDTSSKGCTQKHIPNLPNWSQEGQESMKISSPKCLHPKALSWFFRENIWQFGIVWEMPLTSVYNPASPQNPSNTHLYSKNHPILNKKHTFLFNTAFKVNKIGSYGPSYAHSPKWGIRGKHILILPPEDTKSYPGRIRILSPTHTHLPGKNLPK